MTNYILLAIIWVVMVLDYYITGNTSNTCVRLATMIMLLGGIIIERTKE